MPAAGAVRFVEGIRLHQLERRDRSGAVRVTIGDGVGRLGCLDRRLLSGGAGYRRFPRTNRTTHPAIGRTDTMTALEVDALGLRVALVPPHRAEIQAGTRVIVGSRVTRAMIFQFGRHDHQILALEVGGRNIFSRQSRVRTAGTGEDLMSRLLPSFAKRYYCGLVTCDELV